ncbi:MAG: hypothetical protein AABW59_04495 [archaeon]
MGVIKTVGVLGAGFVVGAIVMFGIALVAVLILGFMGYVPFLSDVMGTAKQKDLGVKFSSADYASGIAKIPGHTIKNASGACLTCNYTSTGSVPVQDSFSQEEFTAQMNALNEEKGPIKDMQFKFNGDGSIEASGMSTDPNLKGPIYVKGIIDSFTTEGVELNVEEAAFGNIGLSGEQLAMAEDYANQAIQMFFAKNPGLSVDDISIGEGFIDFDGTFPKSIVGESN